MNIYYYTLCAKFGSHCRCNPVISFVTKNDVFVLGFPKFVISLVVSAVTTTEKISHVKFNYFENALPYRQIGFVLWWTVCKDFK